MPNTTTTLAFPTSETEFIIYTTLNHTVRSSVIYDRGSGCTCQMYRFEGTCAHSRALKKQVTHEQIGVNTLLPLENDIAPKDCPILCINEETAIATKIPLTIGNMSASSLIHALDVSGYTEDIQKAIDDPDSFLNPMRIEWELKKAVTDTLSLLSNEVLTVGTGAPVLTKDAAQQVDSNMVLEDDFDSSLTTETKDSEVKPLPPANAARWASTKRPDPKSFYVNAKVWEQLLFTMDNGGNVLITGPSGSGKSELVYLAAKALQHPIAAFNFGAMQEPRTALIGATHFDKEKGTWFAESRFVKAVKEPRGTILLDELTRDRGSSAHNILLPLLDRQGYLALDEHDESPIVKKGDKVSFVATANIGTEYTGTEALDKAMKDRMDIVIEMEWPPKQYEVKILMSRCPGLRAASAAALVDIAETQRKLAVEDMEFSEQISTRMLISAGIRIGNGMEFADAVKFSISNHFSSEGGDSSERTQVMQICQKQTKN